jgi:hypothetical protein
VTKSPDSHLAGTFLNARLGELPILLRMDAAQIQIGRVRNRWLDRGRAYKVLIDGEMVGEVRHGESRGFQVPPGRHQLRLRIDWTSSQTLDCDLSAGDEAKFRCGPSRPFLIGQLLGMLRISPYIELSPGDSSER